MNCMLSFYRVFVSTVVLLSSCFSLLAVLILVLGVSSANAQTQASCQFVKFNRRFFVNYGHRILDPRNVNDNGTVVGDAYDDADFSVRGFTRWPDGSITYYRRNNPETYFMDRGNSGITVGVTGPAFSLGTPAGTPFLLKDSTFIPCTMT